MSGTAEADCDGQNKRRIYLALQVPRGLKIWNFNRSVMRKELPASTLAELLVTMTVSSLLLLAVYDGLSLVGKLSGNMSSDRFYDEVSALDAVGTWRQRCDSLSLGESCVISFRDGVADTLHVDLSEYECIKEILKYGER